MQTQSVNETSRATESERWLLIRRWIVTYADTYRTPSGMPLDVSDGRQAKIYEIALADIPIAQLTVALERALQTCKFFPTIAEIRQLVEQTNSSGFALKAETEWHNFLLWVRKFYHPDLGITSGAPELSAAVQFAARAAGGIHWIESCAESALLWAKKRFVETFTRVHETGEAERLLTDGEAKRILANLRAGNPIRGKIAESSVVERRPTAATTIQPFVRAAREYPAIEISEEEFESRKREQKERLKQWLDMHGEQKCLPPK